MADVKIDELHVVWERLETLADGDPESVGRITEQIVAREANDNDLFSEALPNIARRLLREPVGSPARGHAERLVSRMKSRNFAPFRDM